MLMSVDLKKGARQKEIRLGEGQGHVMIVTTSCGKWFRFPHVYSLWLQCRQHLVLSGMKVVSRGQVRPVRGGQGLCIKRCCKGPD